MTDFTFFFVYLCFNLFTRTCSHELLCMYLIGGLQGEASYHIAFWQFWVIRSNTFQP